MLEVGNKKGRLTLIEKLPDGYWKCLCSCGKYTTTHRAYVTKGVTKSCGCIRIELVKKRSTKHNLSNTKEYRHWQEIKQRCYNPKEKAYPYYGGRGITVCDEWKNSFETFYKDMYPKPEPCNLYSLDRIDNNKGYSLENCRWATMKEQSNNRRPRSKRNT